VWCIYLYCVMYIFIISVISLFGICVNASFIQENSCSEVGNFV
jgi:hypothetical protein